MHGNGSHSGSPKLGGLESDQTVIWIRSVTKWNWSNGCGALLLQWILMRPGFRFFIESESAGGSKSVEELKEIVKIAEIHLFG